jgi:DNA-binding NarL/FixJ family response regulator
LSNREKEVLNLITTGLSNIEIGESLYLSPRTIEKYVSSLLRKTQTNNRAELVRFALEKKLLDENS